MVASIRDLANTLFPNTSTVLQTSQMPQLLSAMNIDIDNNIIRGRSFLFSKNGSRKLSILLNVSLQAYYEQMKAMNKLLPDENQEPTDSPLLSYVSQHKSIEKDKLVSKAMDDSSTGNIQYINNKALALNNASNTQGGSETNNSTNTCPQKVLIFNCYMISIR